MSSFQKKEEQFLKALKDAQYVCERMLPKVKQEAKEGVYFNSARQLSNTHKYYKKWEILEWSIRIMEEILDHVIDFKDNETPLIYRACWALGLNDRSEYYGPGKTNIDYQIKNLKETAKEYILQLNGETDE